ncbi:hypothetical protein M3Y94_00738200 [Aphelenchoides besseyi]|nr:hypothetical protein M3Y94_00738200 [Aphelenchoides besseyi]KAI6231956.1 hypothetical protein M3Y95_00436200 [Aphelenchoides besseyi]
MQFKVVVLLSLLVLAACIDANETHREKRQLLPGVGLGGQRARINARQAANRARINSNLAATRARTNANLLHARTNANLAAARAHRPFLG